MAKVFVAIVTFKRDAPMLIPLLEHLKTQDFQDWSLNIIDTTRASNPDAQSCVLDLQSAVDNVLPGKEATITEYVSKRTGERTWERVANARNALRETFLDGDAEYLFFLDSDILIPSNTLSTLLSNDAQAVSGVYINVLEFKNTSLGRAVTKVSPVAWIKDKEQYRVRPLLMIDVIPPRVFPIFYGGFGCVLLHRDVLKEISIQLRPDAVGTEDIPFYLEMDKKGIIVLLDTRIKCVHLRFPLGDERNKPYDFANYRLDAKRKG